ncbi:TetR/AcrR family transcriptional regulator [Pusillimonas sp. MFBS29]|uniref:TetR/AcrR family transcriptional regulator n=1 Tax=Pusillimonas sp. MFBS29 TaxID=2886690 RepID=UPI001D1056F0|nr:TetR/AcrR family transcriptional regulator [Pusillimonas sp. MFBS29]MCC2595097.1 TetR/AcrR family transcriptional regulator [Pusillimonas sp. MFBS29]
MYTVSASKKKYHHGDLRAALLSDGMALVAEKGPHEWSLRELARRLDVSAMAPYRHFADKEALLAAIATDGYQQLRSRLEAAEKAPAPTTAPLLQQGIAYVRFALDCPALFRLMFGMKIPEGRSPELDAARTAAFGALMRNIQSDDSANKRKVKAMGRWSLVHGLSLLLLDDMIQIPEDVDAETWLAQVLGDTVADA